MTSALTPAWADALERVTRRRSSPILMPVALFVVFKILAESKGASREIPFASFETEFDTLVSQVDPKKRGAGWQPYYHLAGSAGLWTLMRGESKADFSDLAKGKPRSRAALVARADRALIDERLGSELSEPVREALHTSLRELLRQDASELAAKLADVVGTVK